MVAVHRKVVQVAALPTELARLFSQLDIDPQYACGRLSNHLTTLEVRGWVVKVCRPGSPDHRRAGLADTVALIKWWRRR